MPERLRESAYRGHGTPEQNADRDQSHAIVRVRESRDRNTKSDVEHCESEAVQKAELKIGNIQGFAYGTDQQSQNGPIKKRCHVREQQYGYDVPRVGRRRITIVRDVGIVIAELTVPLECVLNVFSLFPRGLGFEFRSR